MGAMLEVHPRSFGPCAALILAGATLWSTPASAYDDVYGTRSGTELRETGHTIELRFDRGYAQLEVERTVFNPIERHDQALFWLDLPTEAVATNLRTLGERKGRPHWYAGELLEAEAAAERYRELTGIGGYYPKDPALLSWRSQGELALQVFPVAPNSEKTVSYTLDMPAYWEDGRWHLYLPALGSEAHPAEIRLNPGEALDQLFVSDEVVARGHYLVSDQGYTLSLAPRDPDPLSLSVASVPTGKRHLAQWRVTLAPKLSEVPQRAQVVLILDLSRSRSSEELEAQRTLALTYLEHFAAPELGAEVSVLGFDREVHQLSAGFVPVAEAQTVLEQAQLTARNGSELGLALEEAAKQLGGRKAKDSARVLVLSDYETAARVRPEQVDAALELGEGIIHLVELRRSDYATLERDDGHAWATLAARSGGVAWRASANIDWDSPYTRAEGVEVFEELARPVRIDAFEVRVDGLAEPLDYDTVMPEGQGVEGLELSAQAVTKLHVEGLLWNQPLREQVSPSRAEGDRWSALVFGTHVMHDLDEDEMMVLAMRGGAVSPVTSYLAIEPGVRPSTEGLDWSASGWGLGGGGIGGMGMGSVGTIGHGAGSPPDKQGWLEVELREGWTRCGGAGGSGELALETQTAELLDVALTMTAADAGAHAGLHACMEQITWSLELPSFFGAHETWQVTL